MKRDLLIGIAVGEVNAEMVLRNARLVNVLSGEIHPADIAIAHGRIVGWGDYEAPQIIDLQGRYVCPGFIDGHVHIESSMVTPAEFARAVVPHGTTAVIADPHEIANVLGIEGIHYMLRASENIPLDVLIMASSCVPATTMETAGASIMPKDIVHLLQEPRVIGLAEMMNYPGVLMRVPQVLAMLDAAGSRPIDGHAPGLTGKSLHAYIAAGIRSDHECTSAAEASEKLRAGMHILMREGTAARDLHALLPIVTPGNSRFCSFCTDDRHPADLLDEGHIDDLVRKAVAAGIDPVIAIQMATLNTARHYRLWDVGAIAPGYRADILVLEDLHQITISHVFKDGRLVAKDGSMVAAEVWLSLSPVRSTMHVRPNELSFSVPAPAGSARLRVIGVRAGQIVTDSLVIEPSVERGEVIADPERDLLKIAVVERHHATGRVGLGFIKGFGLKRGALASSVAHDSHNVVVIGASDTDMKHALAVVANSAGGQAVVSGGQILAHLPLPIAGLLSDQPLHVVRDKVEALTRTCHELGCTLPDPMMTLSFMALPVIPALKLTDKGLIDVESFSIVPLWA